MAADTPIAAQRSSAAPSEGEGEPFVQPGVASMPPWETAELPPPPAFTWRNWAALIGPGIVLGGSAIGGGEWLVGPTLTARYGGALLWLATLSILAQVVYNLEISRYTLYTGEPIFTGKFRTPLGPRFWLCTYLLLDFGSLFPYLAANAATPLAAVLLGEIPDDKIAWHRHLITGLGIGVFLGCLFILSVGGKVYNSLRFLMAFKIAFVMSFLLLIAALFISAETWGEVFRGFVRFGTVPVRVSEDHNGNGQLDDGEDWDGDGRLDVVEERYQPDVDADGDGKLEAYSDRNGDGRPDKFHDVDGDGVCDGDNVDNVFVAWREGRRMPPLDLTMLSTIAALVAIAGSGGLTNSAISNYTRDQGWGMGWHVGAIPSVFGGRHLELSHVGKVFRVSAESLERWRGWLRHVMRDQWVVWMPACFFGLALPSMLSVEFLPRGTEASQWTAAGLTADAIGARASTQYGLTAGQFFWYGTLLCGFLVLGPSMAGTADGVLRRWVDVVWTSSPRLRQLDPAQIRYVYFGVLILYCVWGCIMLLSFNPTRLLTIASLAANLALGVSCFHTLVVNVTLLPRALRPGWASRIALACSGMFFLTLAVITIGVEIARRAGFQP